MDTIFIETQPTLSRNVASVKAVLSNFDFMGPLRGPCLWVEMFNPEGKSFDGQHVRVDGADWQNWPCDQTAEQDYEYISNVILRKIGLDKRHKLYFTQTPQSQIFVEGQSYNFNCSVYAYPDEVNYKWFKDNQEIEGAENNSYSIQNAQSSQTGVYSVVAYNTEFSITGTAYLADIIPMF